MKPLNEDDLCEYEAIFKDGRSVIFEFQSDATEYFLKSEAEIEYEYKYRASPFDDGWAYDHFEFPDIVSIKKV